MKRYIEEQLLAWKNKSKRLPLVFLGARQVGKTYTLKKFAEQNFKHYHYINCEKSKENITKVFAQDLDPQKIIDRLSVELNLAINNSDLLILDEIQAIPHAITSLKYFCEEMPELPIIAAGSLLGLKLNEESFPVGKVDYLHMYPMTFFEFLEGLEEKILLKNLFKELEYRNKPLSNLIHDKLWEKLKIYFIIGGLPAAINAYRDTSGSAFEKYSAVRDMQEKLIDSYFDDISKHSGKENAMHIERLWKNIPNQLAREQDGSSSKFQFKGIIPGIKSYANLVGTIDWLEAARLIIKVKIANQARTPLSAFSKQNSFKLFCFDVGLLGAMSELHVKEILSYDYGQYKGYFAENFVAQELRARNFKNNNLYSWSESRAEIEFIINSEKHDIIPIEVKSGSNTQAKSLKSFQDRYNPNFGLILSAQNYSFDEVKKVYRYPLYLASLLPDLI